MNQYPLVVNIWGPDNIREKHAFPLDTSGINKTDDSIIYHDNIRVYGDDTVENIKYKISTLLDNKNIENYYLFYEKEVHYDNLSIIFDGLKERKNNDYIIYKSLEVFCLNHNVDIQEEYSDNDKIYFNDFEKILNYQKDFKVWNAMSVELNINEVVVNPYKNKFDYYSRSKSTNGNLYFEYNIFENNIHLVLANDYYEFVNENRNVSIENTINNYFPILHKKDIFEISGILNQSLKDKETYFQNIDIQNNSFDRNRQKLSFKKYITNLQFVFYANHELKFPLETLFKILHASKTIPFIKYNPGRKMESIYRIYSPNKDAYGKKVPYLSKNIIQKLDKNIKKSKVISLFIYHKLKNQKHSVLLEINENGNIFFSIEKIKIVEISEIYEIIDTILNSFIGKIHEKFDQEGLLYRNFENLNATNIEIIDMNYVIEYNNEGKFSIDSAFHNCLSPVFNIIDKKINSIRMRYKRVSNYNNLNDIDSTVIELFNRQIPFQDIEQIISHRFEISLEIARDTIKSIVMRYDLSALQNENVRGMLKFKVNPGIFIDVNMNDSKYVVSVLNINNARYIDFIEKYVTIFMYLSQNIVFDNELNKYCKDFKKIDETVLEVHQEKQREENNDEYSIENDNKEQDQEEDQEQQKDNKQEKTVFDLDLDLDLDGMMMKVLIVLKKNR